MMNTTLDNIMIYDDWEKNTTQLCTIGEKANRFIETKYFAKEYLDFFNEQSSAVLAFQELVHYRHQFWITHPLRCERIKQWLTDLGHFISTTLSANNRLGLLKEFIWAKYSTLPLIVFIAAELQHDYASEIKEINKLINSVEPLLKNERGLSQDLALIERRRLSANTVKQTQKQRFLNVYQIKVPKLEQALYCEVIETWDFKHNEENITLCLPLSIGCVANCAMCEFSLFKAINIPTSTLTQIIDYQVRNNFHAPLLDKAQYGFYYLGGGDALQYKALPTLLTYVSKIYKNPKQVISTIAFGKKESFKAFLEQISTIPNLGLQWSLNRFDEAKRKLITGCALLLPVKTCVELLEDYVRNSGRKVTVSLMLLKNDDYDKLKKDILHYLSPTFFKLNFAHIQSNSLEFSEENKLTEFGSIKNLSEWAIVNKYEAIIDSPPEENNELAFCGEVSHTVFTGNQPHLKERK